MANPALRQFAGDIRLWEKQLDGSRIPVIPVDFADDPSGNQPLEVDTLQFAYTAGTETTVISKRRGARYQQPLHKKSLPGTTDISTTALELPPLILARALFGESSTAIVAAGTATAISVVLPDNIDVPFQLGHRMLTAAAITVTNAAASTTYVAGDDYVIDRRRGQISFPAGSAISAGDTIKVTYGYGAHVSQTIVGGATPSKKFYITGDMEDRITGDNGELTVPEAELTVDGEIDWLSTEPIKVALTGTCIIADGETAPYTFVAYKESA